MKACLPALCAIALLICLFPSQSLVAAPTQTPVAAPTIWATHSRGVESYRENLARLRSPASVQPQIIPSKISAPAAEVEPSDGTYEKVDGVAPENIESSSPSTPVLVPVLVIENPAVDSPQFNLKNRFLEQLAAVRAFQPSWQSSIETERDPYAIIAAAQQRPNPLKGTSPWQDYRISDSLPRISPSVAQAEIKRHIVRVRERLPRTDISAPEVIKPESIRQTVEEATESIKSRLLSALIWIEQAVHRATEQVERI